MSTTKASTTKKTAVVPPPKPATPVASDAEEHSSAGGAGDKPAATKKAIIKYTESELETLKVLGGAGKSFEEIAAALPGRNPSAIKSKLEGLTMALIEAGTSNELAHAAYNIPLEWIVKKIASQEKAKLHPRQTKKQKEADAKKAEDNTLTVASAKSVRDLSDKVDALTVKVDALVAKLE